MLKLVQIACANEAEVWKRVIKCFCGMPIVLLISYGRTLPQLVSVADLHGDTSDPEIVADHLTVFFEVRFLFLALSIMGGKLCMQCQRGLFHGSAVK